MTNWQPGDPLYPLPDVDEAAPPPGTRHGGGRPMVWRAGKAQPGPWPWLQPGPAPVGLEVAA